MCKRGNRRDARVAYMHTACTIGGVMQPGAGTTVERQVEGEFGDRSPVLKPNQAKPNHTLHSSSRQVQVNDKYRTSKDGRRGVDLGGFRFTRQALDSAVCL